MKKVFLNAIHFIFIFFLVLLACSTAYAEWYYYDIILNGDIKSAYFSGWKDFDCTQLGATALKKATVPKDYRDSYAEFMEQSCIKGRNDNKYLKGDRQKGEKEIKYLEQLFIDRFHMLRAK